VDIIDLNFSLFGLSIIHFFIFNNTIIWRHEKVILIKFGLYIFGKKIYNFDFRKKK
jgi:hypothetical protein